VRNAILLALFLPAAAHGQEVRDVERGTLEVLIKTQGTVRAEDVFRVRSTIDGRIESVDGKPRTWASGSDSIVKILNKEYAALMDSKQSTPGQVLEKRWQRVYKPTPVRCPDQCYVLKIFASPMKWVKSGTLLLEAARKLRLVGRIRPGDTRWIKDGQLLTFWDKQKPRRKVQGRVEAFQLDVQGNSVEPGGMFTTLLDSRYYLDPGTEWEGEIKALVRKDVLHVPTQALIRHDGEIFLPVRVSTGITTYDLTEITAGVAERTHFLVLDPDKLGQVELHRPKGLAPPPAAKPEEKTAYEGRRERPRQRRSKKRRKRSRPAEEFDGIKKPVRKEAEPIRAFPEESEVREDDRFPSDLESD